jgi:phage-related protein
MLRDMVRNLLQQTCFHILPPHQRLKVVAEDRYMLARFWHIANLIQTMGLKRVRGPYIDHIEGPLWEIRMKGQAGIARPLYVTARERRVVVLRVFVKKTQKTPRREIKLAMERAKDVR